MITPATHTEAAPDPLVGPALARRSGAAARSAQVAVGTLLALGLFVGGACSSGSGESHGRAKATSVPALPSGAVAGVLARFQKLKAVRMNARGLSLYEGPARARVIIHKFGDFNCSHCFHASQLLAEALRRHPGQVRIYYRQFPLDGRCNGLVGRKGDGTSCLGALSALCAGKQGMGPAMVHGIYELQIRMQPITSERTKLLAIRSRGDWGRLQACVKTRSTARMLRRDVDAGASLNIQATPTLVVNGRLLPAGTPDRKDFLQLLDALLAGR